MIMAVSSLVSAADYNFASVQANKVITMSPGNEGTGTIYFYNIDGDCTTHITLEISQAPDNWHVKIEPPLQETQVDIDGKEVTVLENMHVEPSEALAEEPENGAFLDTLGWIYYMQGRYAEALEQLQKAKVQVEDDPTVWEHLGDTYLKLNNRSAAVEHWKKAIELAPDNEKLVERLRAGGISLNDLPAATDDHEDTPPLP